MPNLMQTEKIEIGNAPPVPRSGGIEEENALFALIDLCKSDEVIERDRIAKMRDSLTPWVAQQSGILSEVLDRDGHVVEAMRMAGFSVTVASLIQDYVRLSANLLSAGNIHFKHGERDFARRCYEAILELPPLNARNERIGAHQGMANYYLAVENFQDAAYHFDRFLVFLDSLVPGPAREPILLEASRAYAKSGDVAGILFCAERIPSLSVEQYEAMLLTTGVNLDEAMLIVARLRTFGSLELARRLLDGWYASGTIIERTTDGKK